METTDNRRRALLNAALGFVRLTPQQPELRLLHRWLDSWRGAGAVIDGMLRQGYETSLTGGPTGWWASFLQRRPMGGAPDVVGVAQDPKPWRAVQRAAWDALRKVENAA
jgi:hypothetical protein